MGLISQGGGGACPFDSCTAPRALEASRRLPAGVVFAE